MRRSCPPASARETPRSFEARSSLGDVVVEAVGDNSFEPRSEGAAFQRARSGPTHDWHGVRNELDVHRRTPQNVGGLEDIAACVGLLELDLGELANVVERQPPGVRRQRLRDKRRGDAPELLAPLCRLGSVLLAASSEDALQLRVRARVHGPALPPVSRLACHGSMKCLLGRRRCRLVRATRRQLFDDNDRHIGAM
jgi:hypothetical protein